MCTTHFLLAIVRVMRIMHFMVRNKRLFHPTHNSRIPNPQPCHAATLTDAHIAAMRAGGMSIRAIRRALGLSETAATAAGLLEPGRLVAAPVPAGGATNAHGLGGPGMAEVLAAVSRDSGIDCKTLIAPGQRQPVVRARQLVTYLLEAPNIRFSTSGLAFQTGRIGTRLAPSPSTASIAAAAWSSLLSNKCE